jgi:hypothetical protein
MCICWFNILIFICFLSLEGTVDDHCSVQEVQNSSLNESVSFCTTLKPQTELSLSLFYTCQQVLKLRELLQNEPIQWDIIKLEAELSLNGEKKLYTTGYVIVFI